MQTTIYITLGIVAVLAVIGYFLFFRSGKTPSVAMFGGIEGTLMQLQRHAFNNVVSPKTAKNPSEAEMQKMMQQTGTIHNLVRFIYSIENHEEGFLHVISSQLIGKKSQEFHVQCMLFVMLTLTRQLEEFGINEKDVSFDINESDSGTQYLYMLLNPQQHEKIASKSKPG